MTTNHRVPIRPLTLEAIRAHVFVGNAFSDGPAFASITEFASTETNSVSERAEAIRIMGLKGMGLTEAEAGCDMSDQELVKVFIDSF